jgi:antitoxin component YwqK of YwqJK toxin-antitoxin module
MSKEKKVQWEVDYWSNGQKKCETPWVNKQPHGIETWWYEDGHKDLERTWVNGELHGIETWWNENGSLLFVRKWNQGQFVVGFEFKISEVPQGKFAEVDILTKQFNLL